MNSFDLTSYLFSHFQYGMSPLLTAVYGGQIDTVALLLERGADIEAYDKVHPSIIAIVFYLVPV
jgi:ankyrin repeat protein